VSRLRALIQQFKGKRVVVFGDLVADVFVYGEISRISREAPVLILNHRETQTVPGAGPMPFTIYGRWAPGRCRSALSATTPKAIKLVEYFANLEIDVSAIRVAKSYRTPRRCAFWRELFISQRQQIVRLDSGGPSRTTKAQMHTGLDQKTEAGAGERGRAARLRLRLRPGHAAAHLESPDERNFRRRSILASRWRVFADDRCDSE